MASTDDNLEPEDTRIQELLCGRWMAWLIVVGWVGFATHLSMSNPVVLLSDMFGFIERAQQLSATRAEPWVHGLYPFGYPLALRCLFQLTGDYEVAGRVISIVAGACSLLALHRIGTLAFSKSVALLGLVVCATNPLFWVWGFNSGTDMAAAACVIGAVMFGMRSERDGSIAIADVAAAGCCLGLGYLIRYTTLLALPPFVVWLALRPRDLSIRESLGNLVKRAAVFVVSFVFVSSPQLVLSTAVKGSPLWNLQASNVYFGMFGGMNWGTGWQEAVRHTSITEVVAQHPREFLAHFVRNCISVPTQTLVHYPFAFLAGAGVLICMARSMAPTTVAYSRRMLMVLVIVAFSLGVSIAFCVPRFLLCTAILLSMVAAFGFRQVVPRTAEVAGGVLVPVRWPLLLVFLAIVVHRHVIGPVLHPLLPGTLSKMETAAVIRRDGNLDPKRVLSLGYDYYDVPSATKDTFATTWFEPESLGKYSTVEGIVDQMRANDLRYLVFDDNSPKLVAWNEGHWPVSEGEWEKYFTRLSPDGAQATVLKLRNE
jgi:4-amino-4-deoxy-L-arabinose transferase-like glycosyltransferase